MLSFKVRSTGPGLHLAVAINKVDRYRLEVPTEPLLMCLHLPEHDSSQHVISMQMWGKMPHHTVLDQQGRILEDRWLEFSDFRFGDIALGSLFVESARYWHDQNGNSKPVCKVWHGSMHFNGCVEWHYDQDPLLWLLEST